MRASIEAWLLAAWQRRGVFAWLMRPLALVFEFIVKFRFALFLLGYKRQYRLAVPVIVVGNIYLGGTGKTPLVMYLLQQLQAAGFRPGVISRGYGAAAERVIVLADDALAEQVGDEPLLIAARSGVPVAVGRDRVQAAQSLLAAHPEITILVADDGLQHYYLARDVEIMLFDQRGAGNGWMLPSGPLREPLTRRRDFTVVNSTAGETSAPGVPAEAWHMQLQAQALYQLACPTQRLALDCLKAERLWAAAGIGNPERFFSMLQQHGLLFSRLPLSDHHVFDAGSFAALDADYILITEKDAVKCREIPALKNDARIWVLPVEAQLDAGFVTDLLQLISEKKHGRSLA